MALLTPFAQNGDKKAIPETTSDGSVSFDRGFGSFYALPPEEGGLFIDRAQFNQLMFDTTSAVISNQNSINTINSNIENNILSSQFTPVKLYNQEIVKTIGKSGDFTDLQSAFNWALEYRSKQYIQFNLISDIEISANLALSSFTPIILNFNSFKIKGSAQTGVATNFIRFSKTTIQLVKTNIENISLIFSENTYALTINTINAKRTVAKTGQYALFVASGNSALNIYSFEEGVIDCGGFDGSIGLSADTGGIIARTSATLNLQINNANGANSYALKVLQGGRIINTRYFKTTGSTNQTNITKNTLSEEGYILW